MSRRYFDQAQHTKNEANRGTAGNKRTEERGKTPANGVPGLQATVENIRLYLGISDGNE